jgi:hypothetical protein
MRAGLTEADIARAHRYAEASAEAPGMTEIERL